MTDIFLQILFRY